jgi:uncharacterized coiled-coil DUF342 family protein
MDKLLHEADDLINRDKLSRLDDADNKRKELDAVLDDLSDRRDELARKLQLYKDLIAEAKQTARSDPAMI